MTKADKLWGLANAITGFGIAQSIAVIIALAGSEKFVERVQGAPFPIAWLILIGLFLYGVPVIFCWMKEDEYRPYPDEVKNSPFCKHRGIYSGVFLGRMVALILFHILCMWVFCLFQYGGVVAELACEVG